MAPGIGAVLGVRLPLITAVNRGFRGATRHDRATALLDVADRAACARKRSSSAGWRSTSSHARSRRSRSAPGSAFARPPPEADDWITVDSLAHVAGRGILAEAYRWAELEQLVYSPSRWERRLVGSTIATIPYVNRRTGRQPGVAAHALPIIAELIGDAEPDVQKALSWALRSMSFVDEAATIAFLRREAATARDTDDGHRAWVVRDTLEKLPAATAEELRATVDGIRRRPGAPSTSRAAAAAAAFTGLGVAVPPADRPVVDRD